MVLAAYGLNFSERKLRALCDWSPKGSVSSMSVVAAARALGFINSREEYGMRLHDLRDALRAEIFPIVGISLRNYGLVGQHAQVVASVTSRGVRVLDPLLGPFLTSIPVFE
jgi:hypothetical protein